MAMGIVPVAMSLEVAYSVLPSMIYDKKREGESLTSPFALLHFSISSKLGGYWIDTAAVHIWFGDIAKPFSCQQQSESKKVEMGK